MYVTGIFGDSGAGLNILEKHGRAAGKLEKKLINKHILPVPRLKTAGLLSRTGVVTSMIDSSDGLAASLKIITDKSSAGADVSYRKNTGFKGTKGVSLKDKSIHPLDLALDGGEDYELVFTVNPRGAKAVVKNIKRYYLHR